MPLALHKEFRCRHVLSFAVCMGLSYSSSGNLFPNCAVLKIWLSKQLEVRFSNFEPTAVTESAAAELNGLLASHRLSLCWLWFCRDPYTYPVSFPPYSLDKCCWGALQAGDQMRLSHKHHSGPAKVLRPKPVTR